MSPSPGSHNELGGSGESSDRARTESATAAEQSTATLVCAAQAGDRDAFGVVYERYASWVHGILLAHGSDDEAADLVQDVFHRAISHLGTLRDPGAFGGWIAQIARNAARMSHRGALRLVPLTDEMSERLQPAAPESTELDGAAVMAAIRALPEAYREALMLRLVEGLSGAEIAERMGMTHGSVRVNLHRGLAQLRDRFARERTNRPGHGLEQ